MLKALGLGLLLIFLVVFALDYLAEKFPESFKIAEKFVTEYGVAGVFVAVLIGSTLLPSPTDALFIIAVKLSPNNMLPMVLAAIVAAFIGAIINYYMAFFLREKIVARFVKNHELHEAKDLLDKYGPLPILLFGIIPASPVFDPLTFVAGLAQMDFKKFAFYSLISRVLHFGALAVLAVYKIA